MAGLPGTASQRLQPNAYRATNGISQELEEICSQKEHTPHSLLEHFTKPKLEVKREGESNLHPPSEPDACGKPVPAAGPAERRVCSEMC